MQNYFNDTDEVLETTQRILREDILSNQSMLIDNPNFFSLNSYSPYEVAQNLFEDDYYQIKEELEEKDKEYLEELCERYDIGIPTENKEELIKHITDNISGYELSEYLIIDRICKEPLEWWLVSEWLHDKLTEIEEVTLETDWGCYWGRTTSGQAIELDGVIQKIARNIHK